MHKKVVRFRCIRSNGNARKRHETGNGNTGYPLCFRNGLTCFCHFSVYKFLQFRPVYIVDPSWQWRSGATCCLTFQKYSQGLGVDPKIYSAKPDTLKVKFYKPYVCFPWTEFNFDFWVPNYRLHSTFKSVFRSKRSKLDNEQCTGVKCYVTVQSAKASRYETLLSSPHGFSLFNPHYYYREMIPVAPFKIFWSLQCDESLNSLRGRFRKKKDLTDSWWLHK